VQYAIKRMLDTNPMGRKRFLNLRVYADNNHGQQAQKPTPLDLDIVLE